MVVCLQQVETNKGTGLKKNAADPQHFPKCTPKSPKFATSNFQHQPPSEPGSRRQHGAPRWKGASHSGPDW